uniref:Clusterin associated protein 1 n=1 Tax=Mus musculus TaxID=10090 RepID=F6TQ80_MOUSE
MSFRDLRSKAAPGFPVGFPGSRDSPAGPLPEPWAQAGRGSLGQPGADRTLQHLWKVRFHRDDESLGVPTPYFYGEFPHTQLWACL